MTLSLSELMKQLESSVLVADILKNIQEIEKLDVPASSIIWGISSNVTLDQFDITLKKHSLLNQKKARVVMGSFDSHLENIETFKNEEVEYAFFFNFLDALVPSFEARAKTISPELVADLKIKIQNQLQFILKSASSFKMLFIPLFHRMTPAGSLLNADDSLAIIIEDFNEMLRVETKGYVNVSLISLDPVVSHVGQDKAFNTRFYYKFKLPYSIAFFDALSRSLFLTLRGGGAYFYKALILDCDNTLWGGIIGEDYLSGIKLSPHDYPGNIYWTIQHEILALQKKGVLLVLCSKNNQADVDEVLTTHEHRVIQNEHIVLKKVNWQDKPENIRQIAKELNIGLDSFVFIDDSEFECNAVRSQLPQVKTIQVPKNIFDYPKTLEKVKELFISNDEAGSADKTEQYRVRSQAIQEAAKFANKEEYLASLGIKVKVRKNYEKSVARISELTQKSNQFNLTTRRYSPQEITQLMNSQDAAVYSLEVSDKFGDSGLTGIAIVKYAGSELIVDSFLMSCRVIGRGVEFSVWEKIFQDALTKGCTHVCAEFIKTSKNSLVELFFEKLGISMSEELEGNKKYKSKLEIFSATRQPHLEVNYES